jgi:hypothetical protein
MVEGELVLVVFIVYYIMLVFVLVLFTIIENGSVDGDEDIAT